MAEKGIEMVRYADDFVILCPNEAEAKRALEQVQEWTVSAGLQLHPQKTRIVDASQGGGFDFLGYHFERDLRWPRAKSLRKFKRFKDHKIRASQFLQRLAAERTDLFVHWAIGMTGVFA